MRFKSILTGDELSIQELKDYYKVEVITEAEEDNSIQISENTIEQTSLNSGGKTNYYDLPIPSERVLLSRIFSNTVLTDTQLYNSILELFPDTLNDLIEHKKMYPFQHEIFKACYALRERADKDIKGGGILRELNKIKYYVERGIALAKRGDI